MLQDLWNRYALRIIHILSVRTQMVWELLTDLANTKFPPLFGVAQQPLHRLSVPMCRFPQGDFLSQRCPSCSHRMVTSFQCRTWLTKLSHRLTKGHPTLVAGSQVLRGWPKNALMYRIADTTQFHNQRQNRLELGRRLQQRLHNLSQHLISIKKR